MMKKAKTKAGQAFEKEMLKQEVKACFATIQAIAETIRELSPVPEGHLYNAVQSKLSLHSFQRIIEILLASNLVSRSNWLLTWIGPEQSSKSPLADKLKEDDNE